MNLFVGGGYKLFTNILYKIVIPTMIFSTIEFLPSYILRGKAFGIGEFLFKTIGGGTYWFTSALAVCEVLFLIMFLLRKKNITFYLIASVVFFVVGEVLCNIEGISDIWAFRSAFLAMTFLSLGGLFWKVEKHMKKKANAIEALILLVAYGIIALLLNTKAKVLISTLDINILGVFVSLIGIIALIKTCKLFGEFRIMNYIGKNTIMFYFMSGALPNIMSMVVKKIIPNTNGVGFLVVFILSFSFAFVTTALVNKFFPFLLDLRLLSRFKKSK